MLAGSADDWDGFETFHPETEVCAARVSKIKMDEMQVYRRVLSDISHEYLNKQVVKVPESFRNMMDKGNVVKLNRRDVQELPKIVGGVDGCQVC